MVFLRSLDIFALTAEGDLMWEGVFIFTERWVCKKVVYVTAITVMGYVFICRTGVQGKRHTGCPQVLHSYLQILHLEHLQSLLNHDCIHALNI